MWIGIVTFTPASQLIPPGWELQPPEFIRGEAYPQSDIYGLGATLHHALTRRDPRLERAFSWQERPIQQFNPAVPDGFVAVVNRALATEPSKRFATAEDMRQALEALG